ncbi:MAG: site-specific integrase [Lachnospiraceae bacterium]|nr:site-specific integrase [Lachnospiraceae bacterium]
MARHGENIRKRKDGRWEARLLCGYREDGRARYKYIYGKSYAEVKEARNQFLSRNLLYGVWASEYSRTNTKFSSLLSDWLSSVRQNVKESTYSRYQAMVEKHIRPELGGFLLSELSGEIIDQFARKKLYQGNLKKSGGLSPKTVAGFLSVIRLAMDYGAGKGYVCPPHMVIRNPRQKAPEIQILDPGEQRRLETFVLQEKNTVGFGILISLYLGLRIGEVCALRWEDLDIKNGLLSVQRSIQRIPDSGTETDSSVHAKTKIVIDTPKTHSSSRKIPIPSFMLPLFQQYQTEKSCYVLTGSPNYLEPRMYYRKYKQLLKKCGLEHFNYHALRHTFATRCVENNFDIKSLSEILGHANVATTLQRYVHPSLHLKRRHMDRLESVAICGQYSGQTMDLEALL